MEYDGFVYLWFDTLKKRFYIGSHWGSVDDSYICSSVWMNRAYRIRREKFRRRILSYVKGTVQDLRNKEQEWLNLIKDAELGNRYYNLRKHAFSVQIGPTRGSSWAKGIKRNPISLETRKCISENSIKRREKRKSNTNEKEPIILSYQRQKRWRKKNQETYNEYMNEYRRMTPKKLAEMLQNPEEIWFEKDHRKRTRLKRATPGWADHGEIRRVYIRALNETVQGRSAVVEHVIPIKSRVICGLHVGENLHVVTERWKRFRPTKLNLLKLELELMELLRQRGLAVTTRGT